MMKKIFFGLAAVLMAGIILSACTPRKRYEQRLKHELESGVRYDSLFHGHYLGMSSKDFYFRCWNLNRQGLIKQGPHNQSVEYQIKDELKYPATMLYYPVFVDDKIYEMPVRFVYDGWTPWNKELSADKLEADILSWFKNIYGEGFIKVADPKHGMAYVKVDGNRRITIFKEDDLHVWAVFTDMSVKEAMTGSLPQAGIPENNNNTGK